MMAELYFIVQIKYIMKDLKHLKIEKIFLTHKQIMLTLIIRMPKM